MGWMLRSTKAAVFYFAAVLAMSLALSAQENSSATSPSPLGGPQDWSNRHVIYTRNVSLDDMLKLRNDPRFMSSIVLHYMREHPDQRVPSATALLNGTEEEDVLNEETVSEDSDFQPPDLWGHSRFRPVRKNKNSKVDWAVPLGATAGMAIGETPAVYTANYTSPSCANDFIVYTIGSNAKTGTQANLIGLNNLYSDGAGTGFCTGSGPSFLFSYAIGSGPSVLSPVPSLDGTKIAWFENSTTAPTNNHAILHITTWVAGEGTSATTGAVAVDVENGTCTSGKSCDVAIDYTNSSYSGCTGTAIKADTNTHSDLYVDYATDTGYFSADNGILYHIKGIFKGTPTVDFCIAVNTAATNNGAGMSGAVFDEELTPAEVFISDSQTLYAYVVVQSVGALTGSYTLKASHPYGANGDITGPGALLDAFNNFIYVFSAHDASGNTSMTQLPTSLASAVEVPLGPATSFNDQVLFYGAFDNNYYTYGPAYGSHPASTLYSCGTDSTNKNTQDLFAIGFNSSTGIANTTPVMSFNKNSNPGAGNGLCSPITEFYDGTTDRIFVGMGDPAKNDGANVVTMWNVTTQLTNTSGTGGTMPTPVAEAVGYLGGTSGFAADNNASSTAQAENVYFSTEDADFSAVTGGYNVNGIYTDGSKFTKTGGLDDDGNAYSSNLLGSSVSWNGVTFTLGPANAADAWQNATINLPAGSFSSLEILATAVNGNLAAQKFIVTYTDNSTTTITQSVSDWFTPQNYPGESIAATTAYRNVYNGTKDNRTFDLYGYTFSLNSAKTVKSITLPPVAVAPDNVVVVLAIALVPSCGGGDYCAVKLTQTALQ